MQSTASHRALYPTKFRTWLSMARTATCAVSVSLALGACGGSNDPGLLVTTGNAAAACSALSSYRLDSAMIGLPTTGASVASATLVAANGAGNSNGEYCLVKGSIHPVDSRAPDIQFELNLPTAWNHRTVQFGGGAYNGSVVTGLTNVSFAPSTQTPLARGYVTYGSDSGHTGNLFDASFAMNDEALMNYGYGHIKKTHDVADAIVRAYYGSSESFLRFFAGGSTGGREALTAVQRFPADYEGAAAAAPTLDFTDLRMIGLAIGRAAYSGSGEYLNQEKQSLVFATTLAACDTLDGAADGIVSNIDGCRAKSAQIMATLRCAGGADLGNACLSDSQLALINLVHDGLSLPYSLAHGQTRYPGYNILEGTDFSVNAYAPGVGLGLGSDPTLESPPSLSGNGYLFSQGVSWVRSFVARDSSFGAVALDPLNPGPLKQRIVDLSSIVGATDPDLSAFKSRGGRLILLQGAADPAASPNSSIAYYNQVVAKMGQTGADEFMRFYLVPGMAHGRGVFTPTWDAVADLDKWVTDGTPPGTLIGVDTSGPTAGRSRPLCVYPAWPKYIGGDVNSASSFTCVKS
jgi:hypothetical protein